MRNLIVRALKACLRLLLAPAVGSHRRRTGPPVAQEHPLQDDAPTLAFHLPQLSPADAFIAKHTDVLTPHDEPLEVIADPTTLVPWYVVIHESARWLTEWKAQQEQQAIAARRAAAQADGDGIEECWADCPCRRLPAAG
ncbi:hypothetical protein ACL02R_27995 [Streptomyces sp. MS19]|uniref:hypothetical protein n=1 Tax=Streptomyces sp. MS19 TaxID=3385972 RepID=UPI0039A2F3D5